jgi:hypothetical protein
MYMYLVEETAALNASTERVITIGCGIITIGCDSQFQSDIHTRGKTILFFIESYKKE